MVLKENPVRWKVMPRGSDQAFVCDELGGRMWFILYFDEGIIVFTSIFGLKYIHFYPTTLPYQHCSTFPASNWLFDSVCLGMIRACLMKKKTTTLLSPLYFMFFSLYLTTGPFSVMDKLFRLAELSAVNNTTIFSAWHFFSPSLQFVAFHFSTSAKCKYWLLFFLISSVFTLYIYIYILGLGLKNRLMETHLVWIGLW